MNAFFKGFMSLFSWVDCFHNQSPKERVDEVLDGFYAEHPWIERDDQKALQKDFEQILKDQSEIR